MESPQDVGPVLLLRVHKAPLLLSAPVSAVARDAWFCRWIQLSQPRGAPLLFPCYQWLEDAESLALRAGAGEQGDRRGRRVWPLGRRRGLPCVGAGDPRQRAEQLGPEVGRGGVGEAVSLLSSPLLCAHSQGLLG